ncbi:MAG TPA: GNAT family N-acetyltransferase [Vicinamibacteria bacterium]|nr:GNAT family N-acetyltransferase [Vicinamibacteria bacterium]
MTPRPRPAALEDAPRIAALINAAYQVERFFVEGDRTSAEEVASLLGRGSFLLAEDGEALVGCVYAEPRGERGYFGLLSVDPGRQVQGLGRRLVAAAEDLLRQKGCRAVEILVVNLREELPPFYRRLGYVEEARVPFPPAVRLLRPCHFISMAKRLDPDVPRPSPAS